MGQINQMELPNLSAVRGSAIIALIGLGILKNFSDSNSLIRINKSYKPNIENKTIYRKLFQEFLKIYKRNKKMFISLNL